MYTFEWRHDDDTKWQRAGRFDSNIKNVCGWIADWLEVCLLNDLIIQVRLVKLDA